MTISVSAYNKLLLNARPSKLFDRTLSGLTMQRFEIGCLLSRICWCDMADLWVLPTGYTTGLLKYIACQILLESPVWIDMCDNITTRQSGLHIGNNSCPCRSLVLIHCSSWPQCLVRHILLDVYVATCYV